MKNSKKLLDFRRKSGLIAVAIAAIMAIGMAACGGGGGDPTHTHDFSGEWKSDATHHWHECPEDGEKDGYAEHTVTTWTQTKAPSIVAAGEQSGNCTVCSASVKQTVAKLAVEVVQISAGTFQMGSSDTQDNGAQPEHKVTLSKGFSMGKYQVTQKEWEAVMGSLPTQPISGDYGKGDNFPVYFVSWYDALVFCNKLSVKDGLTPAYKIDGSTNTDDWGDVPKAKWNDVEIAADSNGWRLPTEAQWEYACRAGTTTAWSTGDTEDDALKDAAWYSANAEGKTHEVGKKTPNAWGLYDMHGNVNEWCQDWYGSYSLSGDDETDPVGASSGSLRVIRGGSWSYNGQNLRSAYRLSLPPSGRNGDIGFRLLRP